MNRSLIIDLLKLLAAQSIVLHHLSVYGPMADALYEVWPTASDAFFVYSRLAVQVFLVMGGFLAAQSIRMNTPTPGWSQMGQSIGRRYLRLIPPYLVAMLFITGVVAVCRHHISGDWLVANPTWSAALAHVLTLQGLLGLPSLSVGVWYVAMDFQLFVLLVLMVTITRTPRLLAWAVAALCAASMLYFNTLGDLDNWALYFFGAYGLGVLAAWQTRSRQHRALFIATLVIACVALWIAPRIRLEVAVVTAVLLAVSTHLRTPTGFWGQWMQRLADCSYGTFLTHYGVIVILSAVWEITAREGVTWALAFTMVGWWLSVGTGMAFYRWVEQPLSQWLSQLGRAPRARVTDHSATHTTPTTQPWPPHTHTPLTSPRLR